MATKNDKKRRRGSSSSSVEIEAVIHKLAAARRAGQPVDYAAAEQDHQNLMPELGDRFRVIRAMEMVAVTPNGAKSAEEYAASLELDQNAAAEFLREALEGYEILEQFDYGGQGRVFKAIQTATNRTVAIKVLLDGPLATKRHRDRFIREIELVSRLKDPGIVTVYDSGTLRDRPYLVMEFVDGLPIDDYMCAERPDVKGRIRLFLQVCDAIAAAHRHGIIHRDLKPTNILVDGTGRVHVLDFGLAKEVGHPSRSGTRAVLSQSGLIVGTLRYLSPEQAWGCTGSIDTRSDVYTLGVVLFELLTGLPPYPTNGVREKVLQRIRYGECTGLRKAIGIAGGDGVVEVKHIDCDLETILSRCLAKEPGRRYQSVVALSDDLQRYLRNDAIEARADSNLYLLKKTFRKFRVHVTIAVAFLVLILAALAGMTVLWNRANNTVRIAQAGLLMGNFVRRAEVHSNEKQRGQAVDMLLKAVEVGDGIPLDDPLVRRQIYTAHHDLAELYFESDRLDEAVEHCDIAIHLSEAFQREDPNDLEWKRLGSYSQRMIGRVAFARAEWDEALRHFQIMLEVREELDRREPDVSYRKLELVDAHNWIGKTARKSNQLNRAVRHDSMACSILGQLHDDEPAMHEYAIRLSRAETRLGVTQMLYKTSDGNERALESFRRARQRMVAIQQREPGNRRHDVVDLLASIEGNIEKVKKRTVRPSDEQSP